MLEAVTKLVKVKTIVTLVLTGVFAFLSCTGKIETREFITIFTVVISFYFGTQHEKTVTTEESTQITDGESK